MFFWENKNNNKNKQKPNTRHPPPLTPKLLNSKFPTNIYRRVNEINPMEYFLLFRLALPTKHFRYQQKIEYCCFLLSQ